MLPNDEKKLAAWSRLNKRWISCKTEILECFKKKGSRLFNERLLHEKIRQDQFRESRSNAGKKGMKSRYQTANTVKALLQLDYNLESSHSISQSDNSSDIQSTTKKEEIPAGHLEALESWLQATYCRTKYDHWTGYEMHDIVTIAGHKNILAEIQELDEYWIRTKKALPRPGDKAPKEFLPRSAGACLKKWNALLDHARTSKPKGLVYGMAQ
jgi:uncharacterized protein YdaU (DUF1376 family)